MGGRVLREAWLRLASPFRDFGPAAGSLYVVDRVLRRISPRLGLQVYEFMVQPIGGARLLPAGLSRNLVAREIVEGDAAIDQMPALAHIKAQRFRQGARCLGVYRKGQLLGYSWYVRGRYEEDEVRCTYELAQREVSVFDFDFYVLPEHRMGIAFLAVWQALNETLVPQGVRCTFSRMTRFNLASRRAHARLGAKRVGSAVFMQAWGVELMASTVAPWVGMTWRPSQRVVLRLHPDVLQQAARAGEAAVPGEERIIG